MIVNKQITTGENEKFVDEYKGFVIVKMYTSKCFVIKGYSGAYTSKEICEKVIDVYLDHLNEQEKINKQ